MSSSATGPVVEDVLPQIVAPQGDTASRLVMLAEAASVMVDPTNSSYHNTYSSQLPTQPTTPRSLRESFESSLAAGPTPLPLPPTPPTPYPWTWRCHECDSEYPLAATRRCLYCSHHFCTTPQTDTRSKRAVPGERDCCDAEFDYCGWAQWGAYRRSVAIIRASEMATSGVISAVNPSNRDTKGPVKRKRGCGIGAGNQDTYAMFGSTTSTVHHMRDGRDAGRMAWKPLSGSVGKEALRRKQRMYISGQYNCWLHCDFPTECICNIFSAWTEGRAHLSDEHDSSVSHEEQRCFGNENDKESQTLGEPERKKKKRKMDTAHPGSAQKLRRSSRLWEKGDKDRR